ncbi:Peptidoglycan/LPS O-acetylase OafA/YrhL, contains acyltransferase and SGNH-hydrolase domains [Geodermatophilus pulveris]|uniref:Peptidoglycan/LPS O-acetylase OafA/YrhL, contains acyltransferase and SGNH-hydrolase domains n=1 Tax=Geodermatophilus pulveris TaxID=1564159 RepID=A0A239J7C0_9ACTN|nr:acyltransferase [Geodermatophilus pulveris]SNT01572.1 Peptidoglycan/LPS O-acetylase OafA/YrhL, contains acyltransferase and SGNH-hydrolase domains [Geodermatophilus pulveris]
MTATDGLVPATRSPPSRRLIGIEGLRGLAALLVLFRHVGQYTSDPAETGLLGRLSEWSAHGLTLFFVLSGFLLYRPYAKAILARQELPSTRRYAANRLLRIYPGYVVVFVLVCLVFGLAALPGQPGAGEQTVGRLSDPATVVLDLSLLHTYVPGYLLTGITPAWSLTAELTFYVVLPLLAVAAAALAARWVGPTVAITAAPAALVVLGLASTAVSVAAQRGLTDAERVAFAWGPTWTAVWDRSLLAQADLFGYGMLVAVLVTVAGRRSGPSWRPGAFVLAALALPALLPLLVVDEQFGARVMGLAAAALLAGVVLPSRHDRGGDTLLARCLDWSPIRYLGLISYSVYLWHVPVIWGMERHSLTFGDDAGGLLLNTGVTAVIVVGLSTVTYFLVERPALARQVPWRRAPRDRPPSGPPAPFLDPPAPSPDAGRQVRRRRPASRP